jgi:nucleotide-binding universal stress UspA family protein
MGTTGAAGLKGVLLGSTAGGVLTGSSHPVLVIPKGAAFRDYSRFVFATDFKMKADERSMSALRGLLSIEKAGLEVVHVIEKQGAAKPGRDLEMALTRKLDNIPHIFHYIHDNNVPRAIGLFLESVNATGLITVAHEHTLLHKLFFKSVSRALFRRLPEQRPELKHIRKITRLITNALSLISLSADNLTGSHQDGSYRHPSLVSFRYFRCRN